MYQRGNKFGGDRGGKKFGEGGGGFAKRSFGGDRGGYRDGGRMQMHKAVCDECGRPCEVPFKPSGERPVYCNNCFKKNESGNGSPRRPERDSGKSYESNKSYGEKSYGGGGSNNNSGQFQEQFAILNAKLDQILKALTDIGEEGDEDYDDDEDSQNENGEEA